MSLDAINDVSYADRYAALERAVELLRDERNAGNPSTTSYVRDLAAQLTHALNDAAKNGFYFRVKNGDFNGSWKLGSVLSIEPMQYEMGIGTLARGAA